jgi:hypothetical protein
MGLPFRSGHVLGVRRFPASSIGPAYTSVWHRSPAGAWTFYGDTPPMLSCTRYFGSEVESFVPVEITVEWPAPRSLRVAIPEVRFELAARLRPTLITRGMNAMGQVLPDAVWKNSVVLDVMAAVAGLALGAGKLKMRGHAPNGQAFIANPMLIWTIPDASASLGDEQFGPVGALEQAWLGDFAIPQRGIFAIGQAFFEPFDEARPLAVASQRP